MTQMMSIYTALWYKILLHAYACTCIDDAVGNMHLLMLAISTMDSPLAAIAQTLCL